MSLTLLGCATLRAVADEETTTSYFIGLVLVSLFALWLFPSSSLAAPYWEVVVVDEHGKPVEGMTVRETWQNYSVEMEGHEADRQTDASGRATFPAQKAEYSLLRQISGTILALVRLNVHASYGPHAHVFALGKGLEGTTTTGGFVTDWTGFLPYMHSRIIVTPMILPSSMGGGVPQQLPAFGVIGRGVPSVVVVMLPLRSLTSSGVSSAGNLPPVSFPRPSARSPDETAHPRSGISGGANP